MAFPEVTVDELADRLEEGARLVDVREPHEFEEARVPGSRLVPLRSVPDQVGAFRGDGTTYVICRVGGRSANACGYLADLGADVANVAGGVEAWIASGRAIATGGT
jgi:rhodanese-related sulfurtransferase